MTRRMDGKAVDKANGWALGRWLTRRLTRCAVDKVSNKAVNRKRVDKAVNKRRRLAEGMVDKVK